MKALRFDGGSGVRLDALATPECAEGDVLCDVLRAGVCGTDLAAIGKGAPPLAPGRIPGHEGVLRRTDTGARVLVNPLIGCGKCETCASGRSHVCPKREVIGVHRDGLFADAVVVPESALIPADGLSDRQAAMVEPLAVALHAINLAGPGRIAVLGAGAIGLCAVWILNKHGRSGTEITDLSPERLAMAQQLGAHPVRDGTTAAFDAVIDCAGVDATRAGALTLVKPGGRAVFVGLAAPEFTFRPGMIISAEKSIHGAFGYTPGEFSEAADLARNFAEPWVTEYPLSAAEAVMHDLLRGVIAAGTVKCQFIVDQA